MNEQPRSNRGWKITSFVLLAALIGYAIASPPSHIGGANAEASQSGEAVATVNNVKISKSQLYDAMVTSGGKQTLDTLIDNEIIRQEAEKAGITVSDADIDAQLASIKKSFSTEEEFEQALTNYGMTLDGLKSNLHNQVMLEKILEPQVTVTDADIEKYYNDNLESLKTPEQVQASTILVATKEEADSILADLKNGADFAAVAKEKSTDAETKDKGGDLGYFSKGEKEEAVETAAFSTPVGSLSGVIQTSGGFQIIKVTDHKDAATPTLEEKKDEIRQQLVNEQTSTLSEQWLNDKKSSASIENYL